MLYFFVHDHAKADLCALWLSDPAAAAKIEAVLQELQGNQDLLDRLTQNDFGRAGRDAINVRAIENQRQAGNNLWRLKVWSLEGRGQTYRVIYAFIPATRHHYVLGVMPREIDYDRDDAFIRRVEAVYDELRQGRW